MREHLLNLAGRPDRRATHRHPLDNQMECRQRRDLVVGRAYLDVGPAGSEQAKIALQGEIGGRHGRYDQIEGAAVLPGPLLVLVRGDKGVRAHGQGVVLLGRGPGNRNHLARAEALREHDAQVAQPPDADDADRLARPAAVQLQRAVDGDARAEQRRGLVAGQRVRDAHDKVARDARVRRVASHALGPVGEPRVVGADRLAAVVLEPGAALVAVQTAAGLRADADAIADPQALGGGHLLADAHGDADDLVTHAARVDGRTPARS